MYKRFTYFLSLLAPVMCIAAGEGAPTIEGALPTSAPATAKPSAKVEAPHIAAMKKVVDFIGRSTYQEDATFLTPPKGEDPLSVFQELTNVFRESYKKELLRIDQKETIWGDYLKALMTAYKAPITKHSPADWQEIYDQIGQCNKEGGMTYEDFVLRSFILTHLATEPERRGKLIITANTKIYVVSWLLARDEEGDSTCWKNMEKIKERSQQFNPTARLFNSLEAVPGLFPDFIPMLYPYELKVSEIVETLPNRDCPLFPTGFVAKPCMADGKEHTPAEFAIHDFAHAVVCLLKLRNLRIKLQHSGEELVAPSLYTKKNLEKIWSLLRKRRKVYNMLVGGTREAIKKLPEGQNKEDISEIPFNLFHEGVFSVEEIASFFMKPETMKAYLSKQPDIKEVLERWQKSCNQDNYFQKFVGLLSFSDDEKKTLENFVASVDKGIKLNLESLVFCKGARKHEDRTISIETEGAILPGWVIPNFPVKISAGAKHSKQWENDVVALAKYTGNEKSFFESIFVRGFEREYEIAEAYFKVFPRENVSKSDSPPLTVSGLLKQ